MKKTQSQLIKNTEELKIKTRRRLIGSIALLLIAIFILVKINYKGYQHKNNIAITVIKNNESNLNSTNTSNNVINQNINNESSGESNIKKIESNYINSQVTESVNFNNNLESIIKKNDNKKDIHNRNNHTNQHNNHYFKPKIVADVENISNPDDILNNITNPKKFYVQFIALDNKEKILLEKKYLQELGVKTILSQVKIKNKIFYRLRSNSFNSKEKVVDYLNNINNKLG